VPLFRRRAERTLAALFPDVPLACASLDVNRPWAEQGVEPASADLVWGVNVFHLARDLDAVSAEARGALEPGRLARVGEGIRPSAGAGRSGVPARDPRELHRRARRGFLTRRSGSPRSGRRASPCRRRAGRDPLRALYPGFFAAAIQARTSVGVTPARDGPPGEVQDPGSTHTSSRHADREPDREPDLGGWPRTPKSHICAPSSAPTAAGIGSECAAPVAKTAATTASGVRREAERREQQVILDEDEQVRRDAGRERACDPSPLRDQPGGVRLGRARGRPSARERSGAGRARSSGRPRSRRRCRARGGAR
jgi:hypothetical protein